MCSLSLTVYNDNVLSVGIWKTIARCDNGMIGMNTYKYNI